MKRLLLLLLFIPALLSAQKDQQYLAGAVPEIDGKVVFTKEFNAPSLSQDQIYDILLKWAQEYFNNEKERVVYTNKEKGEIAAIGNNYIIFTSTAISLDRALMSFQMTIECKGHNCIMKITAIRYTYDVSYQREPEKYTAEEIITDKNAISKKGTLVRGFAKFRKSTIDYVNKTMDSALAALNLQTNPQQIASAVTTPVAPTAPTASVVPATPLSPAMTAEPATASKPMEGFISVKPDQIPSTILQLLPDSKITIVPESATELTETNAAWKGISTIFGRKVASFSIDPNSHVYKVIGNEGIYKISFLNKDDASGNAWMIIECKKQGETPDGQRVSILGEITNVWIK